MARYLHQATRLPRQRSLVVNIPRSSIYELTDHGAQRPILHNVSLTILPDESWAVISAASSSAGKAAFFGALTGTHRISPPPPPPHGLFPFLRDADPHKHVRAVRFAHRGKWSGEGFVDFTARYGAMWEGDRRTLRETFFPDTARPIHELAVPALHAHPDAVEGGIGTRKQEQENKRVYFEFLVERLRLGDLLDLPMVALSNGQTRRARIAQALLDEPRLLLLDEPLTGLDVRSRAILLALLEEFKKPESPRVILGLRAQDPLPDWTTHVALIEENSEVKTGRKQDVFPATFTPSAPVQTRSRPEHTSRPQGSPLIQLTGATVAYGPRKVLSSIDWTIRANSRWHLIGENGAGKTTLLALLTGDHPQSYTQSENVRLFDRERAKWATPLLHRRIGRVSPELFNAFPRRHTLTVWDAIGTGFDGGFVPKGKRRVGFAEDGEPLGSQEEEWRVGRMYDVMRALGPRRWHAQSDLVTSADAEAYFRRPFADLSPGEQGMVLLMRALVGAPPLVLLDEAWSGMDRAMVQAAHRYLQDGGGGLTESQACVVVSHWEEEVPWGAEEGVERYRLDGGEGRQVFP